MQATHEQNVERFYTHGSNHRGLQEGGFLSFGYWTYKDEDYHQAVDSLIKHILISEKPIKSGNILNVACGYGSETIKIYEKIHPEKIFAIDITDRHIEFAKNQIEKSDLCGKIVFEKMDACTMPYKPSSFKYVIGVEGPAHFNTRKIFLQKAFEILDKKGVLLLSDITVNNKVVQKNLINKIFGKVCAKYWFMPKENWMSTDEILETLKEIGFKIDSYEIAGDKVYPGFSKFNLKWTSIYNAFRIRGIRLGIGLTIISWMLGYVYRKQMIDYLFIRAIKPI